MAASEKEYAEILNDDQHIDLPKLRLYARHGIPANVRGEVWIYLLGVLSENRAHEITSVKNKLVHFTDGDKSAPDISKYTRTDCTRYYNTRIVPYYTRLGRPAMGLVQYVTAVENVLGAYLAPRRKIEYQPALVAMVSPFVVTFALEESMFLAFEKFMDLVDGWSNDVPNLVRLREFRHLVRVVQPELYAYFEEEEVDLTEIGSTWLFWFFSREMQMENLLRLWDTYFALLSEAYDLHPFVCVAILGAFKEVLEELDQSEIRSLLLRLPMLDVGRLVNEALNMRLAYRHRQRLHTESLHALAVD